MAGCLGSPPKSGHGHKTYAWGYAVHIYMHFLMRKRGLCFVTCALSNGVCFDIYAFNTLWPVCCDTQRHSRCIKHTFCKFGYALRYAAGHMRTCQDDAK